MNGCAGATVPRKHCPEPVPGRDGLGARPWPPDLLFGRTLRRDRWSARFVRPCREGALNPVLAARMAAGAQTSTSPGKPVDGVQRARLLQAQHFARAQATLSLLDHPHTGLPRRYPAHQAAVPTLGTSPLRRIEITENSETIARTLNNSRPTASVGP